MKWPLLRKPAAHVGKPIRGRVHRVSVVQEGELSIVVRFGLEELEGAKRLLSGTPVEVFVLERPPAKDTKP